MTLALREPAIHPEGNAIFGYDGGNHFARNGKVRPRSVFAGERPLRAIFVRPLLPEETSFAAVLSGKTVFYRRKHHFLFTTIFARSTVHRLLEQTKKGVIVGDAGLGGNLL